MEITNKRDIKVLAYWADLVAKIWLESIGEPGDGSVEMKVGTPPQAPSGTEWRLISRLEGGLISLHVAVDTAQDVHAVHYANATNNTCQMEITKLDNPPIIFSLPSMTETTEYIAKNKRPNMETWSVRLTSG